MNGMRWISRLAIIDLCFCPPGCGPFERQESGDGGFEKRLLWIALPFTLRPGDYGREFEFDGLLRHYEVHVPPGHDPGSPTAVVLLFHGGNSNPPAVAHQSGMDAVADENGFLAVYPAGTNRVSRYIGLHWNEGRPAKDPWRNTIDDVGFVGAVLDDLAGMTAVDTRRVYAAGLSNGALMTYRLASELSDRIAAIAPVAAARTVGEYTPPPPRPVPVMHFHGLEDEFAPFEGGPGRTSPFEGDFPPVPDAIDTWVEHNGCPAEPAAVERIGQALATYYGSCQEGTEIVLWVLEDGGHTWPGGEITPSERRAGVGPINRDISASQLMWAFFQEHRLD